MATRADSTLQPTQILINGSTLEQVQTGSRPGRKSEKGVAESHDKLSARGTRSRSMSPYEASAVEQVMSINRRLVTQIETLRLKVEIDQRHQQATKATVKADADVKLKVKASEVRDLHAQLHGKDEVLKSLEDKNHQKESAIQCLEENIKELKDDVSVSKTYADEIQRQLEELQGARERLESGSAYSEKDAHIRQLEAEVKKLHENLASLEDELARAKEKIAQQGTQLRLVNMDRLNTQAKYKEELARVTKTMRNDVERMRDVMRQQWEEMRDLREQNEHMRSDIREIRNLILTNHQQQHDVARLNTPRGAANQTKVYGHVHSPFDLQPISPTLPALTPKDKKRSQTSNRKKT